MACVLTRLLLPAAHTPAAPQLFATSSLLRWLGMSAALALGPAICLASVLAVWCRPSPAVVAVFEIIRKVRGAAASCRGRFVRMPGAAWRQRRRLAPTQSSAAT